MSRLNFDLDMSQWANWVVLDWTFFVLATALLWLPFPNLNKRFRMRWLLLRYTQPELGKVVGNWQNYLDLMRSAVGAAVIWAFANHLESAPGTPSGWLWLPKASLVVGVLIQTIRLTPPPTLLAPLFYLAGLALVLPGYLEGAFAVLFGWAFAIGAKDIRWQLPMMGTALLLAGFFNHNITEWLLLTALLIFTPSLLSLIFNKRLAFPGREPRTIRTPSRARKMVATSSAPA